MNLTHALPVESVALIKTESDSNTFCNYFRSGLTWYMPFNERKVPHG